MSLSLLLEEYDVSTEEGLAKALGEIEKEEAEVDEALAGVLSRACDLEDRLRTASHAYTRLGEVKNDAQTASDMVDKTAALAKDVSAKVRQLDLARSRVAECQRRVHDLIDLQLCSAGVEAAIKAHDYETAAGHVARFLSMDPGSVAAARARGAPDPRHAMTRATDTLRDHLVRKFEEAARKDDAASVERLYKLFPQIGRAEEGVDLLAKYIATQTEAAIKRASATAEPSGPAAACARVLQAAAAAVERARRTLAAAPPPPPPPPPHSPPRARLPRALALIQPVVSAACARALAGLAAGAGAGAGVGGAGAGAPLEPRAVEPALAELAAAINTITLYFAFLRRKTQMDAASSDEETQRACQEAVEKIIAESDLTRTAQDLLGQYLKLERYFLEENVNKAIKMATPQPGSTTSNLVDDIFFIAKKSIRRSVSTGSVEAVCAVLNEAGALVERGAHALRRWLRPPPRPARLPPPPPPAPSNSLLSAADDDVLDDDAQRQLFLAHMNEAEAGSEWAAQLAADACAWAESLPGAGAGAGARERLASCAGGLAGAGAAYRAARDLAAAAARAALQPRLDAWAQYVAAPPAHKEIEEAEDDADALPAALDVLAADLRGALAPASADALLAALVADLAARIDARFLQNYYDREGGLAVERRVRRLGAWAGAGAAGARERLLRLTRAAALLALERAHHAPAPAPPHARALLARRTDFKIEDIKRLKL